MGRKKHIDLLKEFKKKANKEIPIEKMILFGSRAKGKAHRWSDFDLILVSKKFKDIDSIKRPRKLYDYWEIDYPVDFLCYTPEEFKHMKNQITIVRDAVKNGVEV